MSQLTQLSRILIGALLLGALQNACGGQSTASHGAPGGNDAGSGQSPTGTTTAGNGQGTQTGGSVSVGTGGSSSGTNVGATGGGGTPPNEACDGPRFATGGGPECNNTAMLHWTHDPRSGICRPFHEASCGRQAVNLYDTREACQKACPGGDPNFDACELPSDCHLTSTPLCGFCTSPQSADELISLNGGYDRFFCSGDCIERDPDDTAKYFIPTCVQHECGAEDIRTSAITACTTDQDCSLRAGTACCQRCDGLHVVAVRKDGSFEKQLCTGSDLACDDCEPQFVPGAVAVCGTDQHCQVQYLEQSAP